MGTEDVVVTYRTSPANADAVPASGSKFTNTSYVIVDGVEKGKAEASYDVVSMPSVIKTVSQGTTWNDSYDWGDGTTGAWITEWKLVGNSNSEWGVGVVDLGTTGLTFKDTLPEGMTYVEGSAKYYLYGSGNGYKDSGYYAQSPGVSESERVVSFAIPTSDVATDGHWAGRVEMKYQTAVKASDIGTGSTKTYKNTASAESGETKFPSGSASTDITNKVLSKTLDVKASDTSRVKYTIKVNEQALDLVKGDTLTLSDTMSSNLAYCGGSLKVVDASNSDITSSCGVSVENKTDASGEVKTVLTLTVPDSKALTVTYECTPIGPVGTEVTVSNSCSISGVASGSAENTKKVTVNKADASASGAGYGLTVTKYDADNQGNKLEGAEFTLYTVDKVTGEKTAIDTEATNDKGVVTFGTADEPLSVGVIYFVAETKAPAGFNITDPGHCVVFYPARSGSSSYSDAQEAYDAAVSLGYHPVSASLGVNISAYDKKSTSATAVPQVHKTVEGKETSEKFTFGLFKAKQGADGTWVKDGDAIDSVSAGSDETVSFGALTFSEEGTYRYVISESVADGWKSSGDVVVTVTVSKNDSGDLATEVGYSNASANGAAEVKNTYEATGEATVSVEKTVNGGKTTSDKEFEFGLFNARKEGDSYSQDGSALQTIKVKAGETKSFDKIAYTLADVGTHYYIVAETSELGSGWTKAAPQVVTVNVSDNGDGTLKAEVNGAEKATTLTFDNKYAVSGKAGISVYKTVNGGTTVKSDEEFTFDLYEGEGITGAKLGTVTVKPGEKKGFDELELDSEVTNKKYTVHEVGHDGNGWTPAADVTVLVTARDNGAGGLDVTVMYPNGAEAAVFDDIYEEATGSFQLSLEKTVNGAAPKNGETFEFSATSVDGGPTLVNVTTDEAGKAVFAKVELGDADAGKTYHYTISEVSELDGEHWTKADDVTATVTVGARGDDGELPVAVEYSTGEKATYAAFDNKYTTDGSADIKVSKTVVGGTDAVKDEEFTFELVDTENNVVSSVVAKDGETVAFPNVTYTTDDAGKEFTYTVREVGHTDKGWTADSATTATVKVSEGADRSIKAEVTYDRGDDAATFVNKYEAKGEATISVAKTVKGGTEAVKDESFSFELYKAAKDDNGNWVKDGDEPLETVSVKAGESADFQQFDYTLADDGSVYGYVIHEVGHNTGAWFAADDVTATVTVEDNGDGTMSADVWYSNASEGSDGKAAAAFDNTYGEAAATIKVYKTVNGGSIAEGEKFTFTLLDEAGNQLGAEKAADAQNPIATFDQIDYAAEDSYTYTIHETTETTEGWTNDADMTVTVEVVRDEVNKTLKVASINYGERSYENDGETMAHFNDTYVDAVASGLKVSKKVVGGTDAVKDEIFDFVLKDEDGNLISEAQAKAGETVAFEGVDYSLADAGKEYTYTISEVGHTDKGWTADSDVTVTVKVSQNADRSLKVERTYSRGTDAAEFTNTYSTSAEVVLSLYKTINGQSSDIDFDDEEFSFTLIDPDGTALELITDTVGQVASFSPLEITGEGTWTYVIHEVGHNSDGWVTDEDVQATVTAKDNGDGTLTTSVSYSRVDGTHDAGWFNNKYTGVRDEHNKKKKPEDETETPRKKTDVKDGTSKTGTGGSTPATGDIALGCAPLAAAGGLALVASALRRSRKRNEE